MKFALVSESPLGNLTDYYGGKTYFVQGERYAAIVDIDNAKTYSSKKIAENACVSLNKKVGYTYVVEELE